MLENLSAVPDELRRIDRWVTYRTRPKASGKLDKIPMRPDGSAEARTNDPSTWGTFDAACAAAEGSAALAGVGFVFHGDGIVGIDLDDCVGADGYMEPWALELMDILDSYTEWSPSRKGIHVYVRAILPQCARKRGKVEVYSSGRFFTVTGDAVDGTRLEIRDAQAAVELMCERHLGWVRPGGKPFKVTKQQVHDNRDMAGALVPLLSAARSDDYQAWVRVGLALKSIADDQFDLWDAFSQLSPKYDRERCVLEWQRFKPKVAKPSWIVAMAREDTSVERVRQALCERFQPERAERIANACATPECEEEAAEATLNIRTIDLAAIEPGRVEWLWKPYIPKGMVSMLVGHPGVGKSTMLIDLAARVSTTGRMPDGQPVERCRVGMGMLEDDLRRVTIPRLVAAGADRSRLVALAGVDAPDGSEYAISLPKDAGKLEALIRRERIGLLIMDPITAYMGSRDSNSQQEVRDSIQPLSGIAERTGCAILLSNHTSKAWKERDAAFVGQGSIAFTAVARVQMLLARAPHEGEDRVLWVTKSNVGPDSSVKGQRFVSRIEALHDVPVCSWNRDPWPTGLSEFLNAFKNVRDRPSRDGADGWLEDVLGAEGWVSRKALVDMAKGDGIPERTLARAIDDGIAAGKLVKRGIRSKGVDYALAGTEIEDKEVCNA